MRHTRVVVTGMGMVSPLGLSVEETWRNVLAGHSGVIRFDQLNGFKAEDFSTLIAAPTQQFDPLLYFTAKEVRRIDPFVQLGVAAAEQAFKDSGLSVTEENHKRIGVAMGSGIGGLETLGSSTKKLYELGPRKCSPFFIPAVIVNMVAGHISMRLGLKGPNVSLVSACTTGAHNIGQAARMIAYGDADVMLAGGSEMATTPLGIAGFAACRALSSRNESPETASRPWDKDRDGFVLGDGAGTLVLESLEHAQARGATIFGELAGFGMSADAYHITMPDENGEGAYDAMQAALKDAELLPTEVDYINAHATSTPVGDAIETLAMKRAFGQHAYDLAVSSTKSMTGHLLGAAGAVEAIFTLLAIRDQVAPPTMNLEEPDEGCDLNFVPFEPQSRPIKVAMSNSFGFGGTNGSLIFKKYEG